MQVKWEFTGGSESTGTIEKCTELHVPVPALRTLTRSMRIFARRVLQSCPWRWPSTILIFPEVVSSPASLAGIRLCIYHISCVDSRQFADKNSLEKHLVSKLHKKRLKVLKEKPYTLEESRAAGGEGTSAFYSATSTDMLA